MKLSAGSTGGVIPKNDRWTYEARFRENDQFTAAAFLALLPASAVIIALTGMSHSPILLIIVLSAGIIMRAFPAQMRTVVEIDRRSGIVSITTAGYLPNRRQVRQLHDVDRVAVWERRTRLNAEYFASQYSIVLLGVKGPLALLTTDDKREASTVRDEVATFLRFR
jgi:hypothetical protein